MPNTDLSSGNASITTMNLTPEMVEKLHALLGTQPLAKTSTRRDKPTGKKQASEWPKWDGKRESYKGYTHSLRVKIDVDWDMLGSNKAICLDMINTLPVEKRPRVMHWFQRGGPNDDYDHELFLNHFDENFEDKQAIRAAGEDLTRMRQGAHQPFSNFMNDFEFKLAQADGVEWPGSAKINYLNIGPNERLRAALVPITLSNTNYTMFVSQVRDVAGKLEALNDYVPSGGAKSTKTDYIPRHGKVSGTLLGTNDHPPKKRSSSPHPPTFDSDGDTPMTGVNGMDMKTLTALIHAIQGGGGLEGRGKQ